MRLPQANDRQFFFARTFGDDIGKIGKLSVVGQFLAQRRLNINRSLDILFEVACSWQLYYR